jgi:tRNA A-37 threonylcarbamoyl transferase component Bud32
VEEATQAPAGEPKKFGRYVVQRLIGEGAMGKVFLAQDPVLNRQVAIKVISVDRQLEEATRREFLTRFSTEARLSAQLNHPSIVPVYDAGEEAGVPWIAFQFIDGVTLDKVLRNKGRLSIKWAVHIALDIASALQQAHKIHVVHRDIKPSNVIVDRQGGIAKLTDFGVAKVPWASLTMEGNAMGSPGYMSPEQIEGQSLDERSDIFSLGVVLYEMLTGRHPFVRETVAATAFATMSGKFPPAGALVSGIPQQLDLFLSQCLAVNPEKRIKSATQLIEMLRAVTPGADAPTGTWGMLIGKARPSAVWAGRLAAAAGGIFKSIAAAMKKSGQEPAQKTAAPAQKPETVVMQAGKRPSRLSRRAEKILGGFFARTFRRARRSALAAGIGLGAAVFAALVVIGVVSLEKGSAPVLNVPVNGLNAQEAALVNRFKSWFTLGRLDSAAECADSLELTRAGAVRGLFLSSLVACKRGEYEDAFLSFESVERLPGGEKLLSRNRRFAVNTCMPALKKERAPDALVTILSQKFNAADDPVLKKAVYERPYWLRWNSLRILQAGGKKVDLVRVFILDLKYSKTMHTRLQAIRDLGEIGDRRAVPALKEAKKKGMSDPFVSSAADKCLRTVFKEK